MKAGKSKSKNSIVNGFFLDAAKRSNSKFYYVRSGHCDYRRCQSACCRFRHCGKVRVSGSKEILEKVDYHRDGSQSQYRILNGYEHELKPFLCPLITVDGCCTVHNKRTQPRVCQYFPMTPADGMYIALKKVCSFTFTKHKNPDYKRKKIKEAVVS